MADKAEEKVDDLPVETSDDVAEESPQLTTEEFDSLSEADQDLALEITNPEPESKELGVLEKLRGKIHEATAPKPDKPEPEPADDAGTSEDGDLPDKVTKPDKPAEGKTPEKTPPEADELLAGKYKTVKELEKAHLEVTAAFDRKANLETQFQGVQTQLDALKAPAEEQDPEPDLDFTDPDSYKAHSAWKDRQLQTTLTAMQNQILQGVNQSIQAIPANNSVNKFMADHPEIPASILGAIADYGDKNGKTSLEDAYPDFIESLTGQKVEKQTEPPPGSTSNADSDAAAIKKAAGLDTNLSDVKTEQPDGKKTKPSDMSVEDFERLPEEEQDRLLEQEVG